MKVSFVSGFLWNLKYPEHLLGVFGLKAVAVLHCDTWTYHSADVRAVLNSFECKRH